MSKDYNFIRKNDFEHLKNLCDKHDGWTLSYEKSPTAVWTKPAIQSDFHMIKVLTSYSDISGNVLYDVLHDPEYRHVWDKHMIHSVDVGFLNPNNDLSYYAISCPPPMKNRDFVLLRSWLDTGSELYVLNHSVQHNGFPPKKGFVRGFSHLTGYLIRPLPTGGCSFSYISHTDPRGALPPWLVNRLTDVLAPKMINVLHKACNEYTKWKLENNPHFKPWIYPEQMTLPRISLQQLQIDANSVALEDEEDKCDSETKNKYSKEKSKEKKKGEKKLKKLFDSKKS
ncbi:PCTP-like protein [Armadillidium nasatum]|uniref:START domain-containing protein 10 n=1 Tax=Armadillidium nasatum TaxID=96803 RepID=A0A5N5T4U5_9CRUS|nr:PCTP-like protein [Armadillidium nasatum]